MRDVSFNIHLFLFLLELRFLINTNWDLLSTGEMCKEVNTTRILIRKKLLIFNR